MSGNLMPGLINQSMYGDMNNVETVGIDTVTDTTGGTLYYNDTK